MEGIRGFKRFTPENYYDHFISLLNNFERKLEVNLEHYKNSEEFGETGDRKILKSYDLRLKKIQQLQISGKLYKIIIKKFIEGIKDAITEGYKFHINNLGNWFIKIKENQPHKDSSGLYSYRIDHQATKKNKLHLISTGVKESELFSKAKFESIIEDYISKGYSKERSVLLAKEDRRCGISYIKYHTHPYDTWLTWIKVNTVGKHLDLYAFKPKQDFAKRVLRIAKDDPTKSYLDKFELKVSNNGC